jgi:hypothetical protein
VEAEVRLKKGAPVILEFETVRGGRTLIQERARSF